MHGQAEVVGGIDIDDVEPGFFGTQRRLAVPAAKFADVGFVHRARLHGLVGVDHRMRGRVGHDAAQAIGRVQPVVRKLDCSEAAMRMDAIGHLAQRTEVGIIPEPALIAGREV